MTGPFLTGENSDRSFSLQAEAVLLRLWLERMVPPGPWHDGMVDVAEVGLTFLLILVLFFVLRVLMLHGLNVVMRPLMAAARREGESSVARVRTLEGLARSVLGYALMFLAAITLLDQLGVNVATLIAGAGVAGLALSFGAQRLVRDVLTGFFLLLEDQFRVGEMVTLMGIPGAGQLIGTIEDIGLRITRLTDTSGKHVIVNNGDIGAVVNHSRGPILATVDLGVAPEHSLDKVREAVEKADLPATLFTGEPSVQGVAALEAAKMVVRISARSRPGRTTEAELVLRQAAAQALRAAEIEIK